MVIGQQSVTTRNLSGLFIDLTIIIANESFNIIDIISLTKALSHRFKK